MKTDILEKLRELKFIGPFPGGIEVLLVSVDTAYKEVNYWLHTEFTNSTFKTYLQKNNIFMFGSVDDWAKYKDPEHFAKNRRKRRNGP